MCPGYTFSRKLDVQLSSFSSGPSAVERTCGAIRNVTSAGAFAFFRVCATYVCYRTHCAVLPHGKKSLELHEGTPDTTVTPQMYRPPNVVCKTLLLGHERSNVHLLGRPLGVCPNESHFCPAQRMARLVVAARFSVLFQLAEVHQKI